MNKPKEKKPKRRTVRVTQPYYYDKCDGRYYYIEEGRCILVHPEIKDYGKK